MITGSLRIFGLVLVLLLVPRSGLAIVLVDNTAEVVRAETAIENPEYWAAQSFIPDDAYTLDSISAFVGNETAASDVVAELRSDDGSGEIDLTPAGLLATFTVPALGGAPSARVFTPTGSVPLAAGTRYWFVLGVTSGGFDWSYANTGNWNGPGTLGYFADSSDAGGTWSYHTGPELFFPYMVEVSVSPAPPSVPALPAAGLAALGALLLLAAVRSYVPNST